MDNPYLSTASAFLIDTVFGLYILLVLLRFLLQLARADFYNPICQFLVKATNPPLKPLRRIIPGLWKIDLASVVLLIALQMCALWLLDLAIGRSPSIAGLFVLSTAALLALTLNTFLVAILIQVILSWFGPGSYNNPVFSILYSLNEPLLGPARRLLPSMSGIDFSPLLVLVAVQLLKILVVSPLSDLGRALAYG
ncbi:MAG: YggT family protein [Gammaproteobacteria bacterium]|nr:YggT family protein [Gammaproteobacteria bacterium]